MKVMIVEDEALIALAYTQVVEMAGHRVVGVCRTLEAAAALAAVDPPDAALVDMRLGQGQCGAAVEEHLQRVHGTTGVHITANRDFAFRYRRTAVGFAEKPLPARALLDILTWIERRRAGLDAPAPSRLVLFADPDSPGPRDELPLTPNGPRMARPVVLSAGR